MAWILLRLSNYQQVAPLVRTGGSRHTGLAAPPHRNIHELMDKAEKFYLYKSIASLKVNQSAQNPITYLEAKE